MNGRVIATPVGPLLLEEADGALHRVARADGEAARDQASALLDEAQRQIEAYFAGRLRDFDLPLDVGAGSAFDRAVWRVLRAIPYGELCCYGEVAHALGAPQSSRAVGGACSRNPLLLVVPCHRVVAATGRLTGFAAGLEVKERLLTHEGWQVQNGRVIARAAQHRGPGDASTGRGCDPLFIKKGSHGADAR